MSTPALTRNETVNAVTNVMSRVKKFSAEPPSWNHYIVTSTGAPDLYAIKIFAQVVFRHRAIELKKPERWAGGAEYTHKPAFKGDRWRCNIRELSRSLNMPRQTVSDALKRLDEVGLITREYEKVWWPHNAEHLYVTPVAARLRDITCEIEHLPDDLAILSGFRGAEYGGRREFLSVRASDPTVPTDERDAQPDEPDAQADGSVRPGLEIKNREAVEEAVPASASPPQPQKTAAEPPALAALRRTPAPQEEESSAPPSADASEPIPPATPADHIISALKERINGMKPCPLRTTLEARLQLYLREPETMIRKIKPVCTNASAKVQGKRLPATSEQAVPPAAAEPDRETQRPTRAPKARMTLNELAAAKSGTTVSEAPPALPEVPVVVRVEGRPAPPEANILAVPPTADERKPAKVQGRRVLVGLTGEEAPPEASSDGVNLQTCLEELTRLRELYNNLPEDNPERAKALALLQHVEQVLREHGVEPPAAPPAAAKPFNPKACEDKMASLTCRMRMLDCGQEEHTKLMEEWRELCHQLDTWKAQQPKPVEKPKAGIIHQAPARRPLPGPVLAEEGYDNDQEPTAPPRRRGGRNPNQR